MTALSILKIKTQLLQYYLITHSLLYRLLNESDIILMFLKYCIETDTLSATVISAF